MESLKPFCVRRHFSWSLWACGLLLVGCLPAASLLNAQEHGLSLPSSTAEAHPQEHSESGHSGSPLSSLWKWLNFIILFGGLGWYLRKPLGEFLSTRARGIEEGLANARAARQAALQESSKIKSRLDRLDKDIRAIKEQAAQEAEEERGRILESARQEAQKILDIASREIEGLKKSARLELKAYVAELAVKLAEERLKTVIGTGEDRKIIEKYINSLDSRPN